MLFLSMCGSFSLPIKYHSGQLHPNSIKLICEVNGCYCHRWYTLGEIFFIYLQIIISCITVDNRSLNIHVLAGCLKRS